MIHPFHSLFLVILILIWPPYLSLSGIIYQTTTHEEFYFVGM